jgi:predicted dehydrogenase
MKLLIVGCGSIGRRHALSARTLGYKTAVVDIDDARARAVAAEAESVAYFSNRDSAFGWGADAVVVATPHVQHIADARAAIGAGADVLIEKPLSHDLAGIEALKADCIRAGRRAFVVCNMRYHPAVDALYRGLPQIGTAHYARAHYGNYLPSMRPGADYRTLYCARKASGGGVILDAIHEIDYLMWFFGPVVTVSADKARLSNLDIDVEDFADMALQHQSGARSVITLDYLRHCKRRGCEIIGSKGQLVWESEGKKPERCTVRCFHAATQAWTTLFHSDDLDNVKPYVDMLTDFQNAREGKGDRMQTLDEAAARLAVALAVRDRDYARAVA